MKCERCSKTMTRKTHDGPKKGSTTWFAWYFTCRCGWLFLPGDALRGKAKAKAATTKTSQGGTLECHQCHAKFNTNRQLVEHTCPKADRKHARELERGTAHYGFNRPWLAY